MEQPNQLKFSLLETYSKIVNIVLLNNSLLNYLNKIDILGFHKLMYNGLLTIYKSFFNVLKTIYNIDIKEILLKDNIKNNLAQDSNVLSYFHIIIKNTEYIYINAFLDSILLSIKPMCDILKVDELYSSNKYNDVMKKYKESINDENIYDKFVELFVLVICDGLILYYNYIYDLLFDNNKQIKNINIFTMEIENAIKTIENLSVIAPCE